MIANAGVQIRLVAYRSMDTNDLPIGTSTTRAHMHAASRESYSITLQYLLVNLTGRFIWTVTAHNLILSLWSRITFLIQALATPVTRGALAA